MSHGGGGSLHLRSVVACSASSGGACARSLELDWRQRNVALPYLFHQNSRYGRFAYDDFSEYDSDREVESAQQQQIVSLLLFLWENFRLFVCGVCSVLVELEL